MTNIRLKSSRPHKGRPARLGPQAPWFVVEKLRDAYKLTETDVVRATGAGSRTVRRWREIAKGRNTSTSRMSPYHTKIDALRRVIEILAEAFKPEDVLYWLRFRNPYLDEETPLDALGAGRFDEVRQAAHAVVDGDYI